MLDPFAALPSPRGNGTLALPRVSWPRLFRPVAGQSSGAALVLLDRSLARSSRPEARHATAGAAAEAVLGERLVFRAPPRSLRHGLAADTPSGFGAVRLEHCFTGRGDWTEHIGRVERFRVFHEMRQLIEKRERFRETPIYDLYLRRAREGRPQIRNRVVLGDPETLDRYFRHYLALVERVEAEGYRPARTIRREAGARGWRDRFAPVQEIGVAIDARGRPYRFRNGQHRFAIAHVLGVPEVAFEIVAVHVDYLAALARRDGSGPGPALRGALNDGWPLPRMDPQSHRVPRPS